MNTKLWQLLMERAGPDSYTKLRLIDLLVVCVVMGLGVIVLYVFDTQWGLLAWPLSIIAMWCCQWFVGRDET